MPEGLKFASETEAAAAAKSVPNRQVARLFDVPVVVDEERCIKGCHICVESCPVDCLAIAPATGKSHMKYDDCWYCLACEVDCPTNAITVKIPFLITMSIALDDEQTQQIFLTWRKAWRAENLCQPKILSRIPSIRKTPSAGLPSS